MKEKLLISLITVIMFINFLTADIKKAEASDLKAVNEGSVSLSSENMEKSKTDFNFISTNNHENVIYTYKQNGKLYLVREKSNSDLSKVETEIYDITNGSEILTEKYTTELVKKGNVLIVSKLYDNKVVDTAYIDLGYGYSENVDVEPFSVRPGEDGYIYYDGYLHYDGTTKKYYTSWYYSFSDQDKKAIMEFTLEVVGSILAAICGSKKTVVLERIAEYIVGNMLPEFYWKKDVYLVHEITYPQRRLYGSAIGMRSCVDFYADSARTMKIGSETYEWHDPIEWPTAITIN